MDTNACQQRALDRSRATDPTLARISKVRPGTYQVLGNTNWYEVTVDRDGYHCTCVAGANGKPCWHQGSAFRLRASCRSLKASAAPEAKTSARIELFGRI